MRILVFLVVAFVALVLWSAVFEALGDYTGDTIAQALRVLIPVGVVVLYFKLKA